MRSRDSTTGTPEHSLIYSANPVVANSGGVRRKPGQVDKMTAEMSAG